MAAVSEPFFIGLIDDRQTGEPRQNTKRITTQPRKTPKIKIAVCCKLLSAFHTTHTNCTAIALRRFCVVVAVERASNCRAKRSAATQRRNGGHTEFHMTSLCARLAAARFALFIRAYRMPLHAYKRIGEDSIRRAHNAQSRSTERERKKTHTHTHASPVLYNLQSHHKLRYYTVRARAWGSPSDRGDEQSVCKNQRRTPKKNSTRAGQKSSLPRYIRDAVPRRSRCCPR